MKLTPNSEQANDLVTQGKKWIKKINTEQQPSHIHKRRKDFQMFTYVMFLSVYTATRDFQWFISYLL